MSSRSVAALGRPRAAALYRFLRRRLDPGCLPKFPSPFPNAHSYDAADAYSRSRAAPTLAAPAPGTRIGVPDRLEFFGDGEAEAAFARDVAGLARLGCALVGFDLAPFAEVARLLYDGPWVAERYAATKPLIETHPEALHPVTRAIIEGARKFDAVSAFEAFYGLAALKRTTEAAWRAFDVMVVPTLPRFHTIAEVLADPPRLNSRLGTYTSFVNLLDLAAIAVPAGMRDDGLPSSLALIAPAGADGHAGGVRGRHPGAVRRADGGDGPEARPCSCT